MNKRFDFYFGNTADCEGPSPFLFFYMENFQIHSQVEIGENYPFSKP